MIGPFSAAWVGFLIGLHHAFEPDHMAAVSTLVAKGERRASGVFLGALWGLGHALALFGVVAAIVVLRARLPEWFPSAAEFCVGMMLVGLGAGSVRDAYRRGNTGPEASHRHGGFIHSHAGEGEHVHVMRWTLASRPLLVGLLHGMAGSGALVALALANTPSPGAALAYAASFGIGAAAGMAGLSGLAGIGLRRLAARPNAQALMAGAAGVASMALGLYLGWPMLATLVGI